MPLRLDLIRHGDATPAGSQGDAARALSAIGRRDVTRLAEEYVRQGWRPGLVLASPLRRAQETARILLDALDAGIRLETLPELAGTGGADLITALSRAATVDHVVAIGHQPLMGHVAGVFTGDQSIRFPPAAMAWLEFDGTIAPSEGRLVRSVLPSELP